MDLATRASLQVDLCNKMAAVVISSLHIYPIKGTAGISLSKAKLGSAGLAFDRQWMVVKEATGRFVSQREIPKLALVSLADATAATKHQALLPQLLLDQPSVATSAPAPGRGFAASLLYPCDIVPKIIS